MSSDKKASSIFADTKVDVRIKLSALWAATMFCYLYADILSLYRPDFLEQIMIGEIIGFQINQADRARTKIGCVGQSSIG